MVGVFNNGGKTTHQVETFNRAPAQPFERWKNRNVASVSIFEIERDVDGVGGRSDRYDSYFDSTGQLIGDETEADGTYRIRMSGSAPSGTIALGQSGMGHRLSMFSPDDLPSGTLEESWSVRVDENNRNVYCLDTTNFATNGQNEWSYEWCYGINDAGRSDGYIRYAYRTANGNNGELIGTDFALGGRPVALTPAPAPAPTPPPVLDNSCAVCHTVAAPAPGPSPVPPPAPIGEGPQLPVVDSNGTVRWDGRYLPVDTDFTLFVEPFAFIESAPSGKQQRLNVMAHVQGQLFVGAERTGRIYQISEGAASQLWFDLPAALAIHNQTLNTEDNFHVGMRGVAFHPDFTQNGKFYISAMLDRPITATGTRYLSDVTNPIQADGVLMEWTANPDTLEVDPNSYREVFRVGMPVYDHTIKQIMFGPDKLLYVAHGDGSVKSASAGGGTNLQDALGKILRIDPLATANGPYTVPATNPFVTAGDALPEIYSYGHRNPHHLAFTETGELIVADSGRDNIDEINLIEVGGNHGWSLREGTYVHKAAGGLLDGIDVLPDDDADQNFVYPAIQFGHTGRQGATFVGQALGGGFVVNNNSALNGLYFYCEFASFGDVYFSTTNELQATVRKGAPKDLTQVQIQRARIQFDDDGNTQTPHVPRSSMTDVVNDSPNYDGSGRADIRFGQGPDGTLYIMSKRNGTIYRITNSMPRP